MNSDYLEQRIAFYSKDANLLLVRYFVPDAYIHINDILMKYQFCQMSKREVTSAAIAICNAENDYRKNHLACHQTTENHDVVLVNTGDEMVFVDRDGEKIPICFVIEKAIRDWLGYIISSRDSLFQAINKLICLNLAENAVSIHSIKKSIPSDMTKMTHAIELVESATEHINKLNNISKHRFNLKYSQIAKPGEMEICDIILDDPLERTPISLMRIFDVVDAVYTVFVSALDSALMYIPKSIEPKRVYLTDRITIESVSKIIPSCMKNLLEIGVPREGIFELESLYSDYNQLPYRSFCKCIGNPCANIWITRPCRVPEFNCFDAPQIPKFEVVDEHDDLLGYYISDKKQQDSIFTSYTFKEAKTHAD